MLKQKITLCITNLPAACGLTVQKRLEGIEIFGLSFDDVEKTPDIDVIKRVRITCNTDNIGSARVIAKNGGVFSGQMIYERSGNQIAQYWVEF